MLGRANRLEIGSKIGLIPIGFQSRAGELGEREEGDRWKQGSD